MEGVHQNFLILLISDLYPSAYLSTPRPVGRLRDGAFPTAAQTRASPSLPETHAAGEGGCEAVQMTISSLLKSITWPPPPPGTVPRPTS